MSTFSCFVEIEAKLSNTEDERRVFLERCLSSEEECSKLRSEINESKRKADDQQAALHELGRENQTLQVSTQVYP